MGDGPVCYFQHVAQCIQGQLDTVFKFKDTRVWHQELNLLPDMIPIKIGIPKRLQETHQSEPAEPANCVGLTEFPVTIFAQ